MTFYNIWHTKDNRWTNSEKASDHKNQPFSLSKEEAEKICASLNLPHSTDLFIVKELITAPVESCTLPVPMAYVAAVNDHVCPSCNNNRCSKSEKSCWRCGSSLH